MNILITGGAGFIGSNLSQLHLAKGDQVTVIDNLLTSSEKNIENLLKDKSFIFFKEDLTKFNFDKLQTFDVIYHLASPASPIQYKKYSIETLIVNSYGTKILLDFFAKSKSKIFVLASTSEVYGDPLEHPQKETYWGNVNPVGVRACYDEAKRFAEALTISYFRKYNLNIRIARIFNTYGVNMEKEDGRVVSNFIIQALTNSPITIYGNGKQTRSFCYVSDMINALQFLATIENINGEIINIGNPQEIKIIELAGLIKKMTSCKSDLTFVGIEADDPKKRKPDIAKARTLLNWQPIVQLEDGLKKTIDFFKNRYL